VIARAPNELAVVASLPSAGPLPRTATLLTLIGLGETVLGLAVPIGWQARALAWFQVGLLVVMNGIGIVFAAGSAIPDPVGLVVHNLPFVVCSLASGLAPRTPEPTVSGA
jgi:uncharacterized membrane protein YphA (DoxX/SURF4 family)